MGRNDWENPESVAFAMRRLRVRAPSAPWSLSGGRSTLWRVDLGLASCTMVQSGEGPFEPPPAWAAKTKPGAVFSFADWGQRCRAGGDGPRISAASARIGGIRGVTIDPGNARDAEAPRSTCLGIGQTESSWPSFSRRSGFRGRSLAAPGRSWIAGSSSSSGVLHSSPGRS